MNAHNDNDDENGDDEHRDAEIWGLLAETSAATPPTTLSNLVIATAIAARPSGHVVDSLGGGIRADPAVAFVQTVDEFRTVLAHATGSEVVEPYGWSVTQLVAHLLEVDLYFGRQLGLWDHTIDDSLEEDHLAMTEAAIRNAVKADFTDTVERWFEVSGALRSHVSSVDDEELRRRIKFHMLDARVSSILVVRVFEIWTHTEDLSRALRREPPVLDAARLHLMTRTAVGAIPLGMLLGNIGVGPHTARIVLTGRGGGVWNQPLQLGLAAGEPEVTIVADALEFCRMAAQRVAPGDLDAEVEGPTDLALTVLRGASVFAA
jgi:uncharacterized protein (TIGR03083 family)